MKRKVSGRLGDSGTARDRRVPNRERSINWLASMIDWTVDWTERKVQLRYIYTVMQDDILHTLPAHLKDVLEPISAGMLQY